MFTNHKDPMQHSCLKWLLAWQYQERTVELLMVTNALSFEDSLLSHPEKSTLIIAMKCLVIYKKLSNTVFRNWLSLWLYATSAKLSHLAKFYQLSCSSSPTQALSPLPLIKKICVCKERQN